MIRDRITQFINTYVRQIYVSRGGVLLGRGTGAGPAEEIIIGDGLTLTSGTLTAAGGGSAASDAEYDAATWDGVTTVAPSKNAVRDKFVSVDAAIAGKQAADDDLTAYANALDAAARRALIGALGASDIAPLALTSVPKRYPDLAIGGTGSPASPSATMVFHSIQNGKPRWQTSLDAPLSYVKWDNVNGGTWSHTVLDGMGSVLYSATKLSAADSPVGLTGWTPGPGTGSPTFSNTAPPVIPTAIGQTAIVTHSDATKTEWGAVSLTEWLPRTAGIVKHANGSWYRQTLAADGTAEYELLPNQ